MTVGREFRYPPDQWEQRERTRRLAWASIVLLTSGAALLGLTLGQSQAMKTAWVSDLVTAVPPATMLFAMRHELRPPSRRFPWGYFRVVSIAFLVTAGVTSIVGLYLLLDSLLKLVHGERPPIGTVVLFGRQLWAGWTMVAALAYSMSAGVVLGRLKTPVAEALHGKEQDAEARMNRAEWLSEGAAIVGIIAVGFGLWWGDAAAAAFISVEIVRDGWDSVRQVVRDLMDESPTQLGGHELEDLPTRMKRAAERLAWVERAAVRLREQGHVLTGDVFVVPRAGDGRSAAELTADVGRAAEELRQMDWRLHGLTVMPVERLVDDAPPRL
jgi:divalent metal cation (Fe/Co/Zn/Cd) transporter